MTFELFTTADSSSFPTVEDLQLRFLFHNSTTGENSMPKVYPLFGQSSTELSCTHFRGGMDSFAVSGQEQWRKACGNSTGICAGAAAATSSSGTGTAGSSDPGSGISTAVAGVVGAMITLAVVLGLQAVVVLSAGLRVVRKKRLAEGQSNENGVGEADERKL